MNKELLETILNATKQDFRIFFQNDKVGLHISVTKKLVNRGTRGQDVFLNYEEIENSEFDIVKETIEKAVHNIIKFP